MYNFIILYFYYKYFCYLAEFHLWWLSALLNFHSMICDQRNWCLLLVREQVNCLKMWKSHEDKRTENLRMEWKRSKDPYDAVKGKQLPEIPAVNQQIPSVVWSTSLESRLCCQLFLLEHEALEPTDEKHQEMIAPNAKFDPESSCMELWENALNHDRLICLSGITSG